MKDDIEIKLKEIVRLDQVINWAVKKLHKRADLINIHNDTTGEEYTLKEFKGAFPLYAYGATKIYEDRATRHFTIHIGTEMVNGGEKDGQDVERSDRPTEE